MRIILLLLFFSSSFLGHGQKPDKDSLQGRPINYYLRSEQIPQFTKDLYTGKITPTDTDPAFLTMDSLFTENNTTRAFYFLVVTKMMYKSDGALSEMVGVQSRMFVEERTVHFMDYFTSEEIFTRADLEQWATYVAGEIGISSEGREQAAYLALSKRLRSNCENCNGES